MHKVHQNQERESIKSNEKKITMQCHVGNFGSKSYNRVFIGKFKHYIKNCFKHYNIGEVIGFSVEKQLNCLK